jgi:ribose 5-phosphate isomerase A
VAAAGHSPSEDSSIRPHAGVLNAGGAMSALTAELVAEREKRAAAEIAAMLVESGMTVGLGTGSTVAHLLPALASRKLDLRCVATSRATERAARRLGLRVEPFDVIDWIDIAVDGADQVHRSGWLVKGGGGAHTREKIVAAAARRFIVIVSSDKFVDKLRPPVPIEVAPFGAQATLRALGPVELRAVPPSPDGGLIADYLGSVRYPARLAERLAATPGVVEHGLFGPEFVDEILLARGGEVARLERDQ